MLRNWRTDKGLIVSVSAHAALLGATLLAFSQTPPFDDATETVPVEMISTAEFSQITKGEKSAKVVKPTPKVDKVADITETKPLPPTPAAQKDVPTPPPPLKRMADPGDDDKPEQKEPQKVAALPPPRPVVEEKPAPPKVEPTPPPRPQPMKVEEKPDPEDAEADRPKPVERPKDLPKEQAKDTPKPTPPTPPKPQLKVDEVAKLLEAAKETKPDPKAKADKPTARPKSGTESEEPKSQLDLSAVSKFLDHDKPQRRASTGAQLQQVAAIGAPTGTASKMSPSMWDSLASIIAEQYQRCWSQSGRSQELGYWPVVRVQLRVDGGLATSPVLTNPAGDPDRRALGEAAIRAVRMCDPLRIPAQFASFYAEWKSLPIKMRTEN